MSNVPLARERILDVADKCRAAGLEREAVELERIVETLLFRRPYARPRAPVASIAADGDVPAAMRRFAAAHPELTQQEIAVRFEVNSGRVSEALHHDR